MKKIFTQILVCLLLCVVLLFAFFSSFSKVNAYTTFNDGSVSTYNTFYAVRCDMADDEACMIQHIEDFKYAEKTYGGVAGIDKLNDFFEHLSFLDYIPMFYDSATFMRVYLYSGLGHEGEIQWDYSDPACYGSVPVKFCLDLYKLDGILKVEFYSCTGTIDLSKWVYAYRSDVVNKWLNENLHSLSSSVPSNSDLIGNATNSITNTLSDNTNKLIQNENVNANKIIENEKENTDKIIDNENQNTDKIIDNASQNTQDIINNQNEQAEKDRKHQEDMYFGEDSQNEGSSSNENKKKGLVQSILDGFLDIFVKIFVPDNDYFKNYFDDLNNFFSDRFGFLYYPFELILKVLNGFMNIGDYDSEPVSMNDKINKSILIENANGFYRFKDGRGNNARIFEFNLEEGYTLTMKARFDVVPTTSTFFNFYAKTISPYAIPESGFGSIEDMATGVEQVRTYKATQNTKVTLICFGNYNSENLFFDIDLKIAKEGSGAFTFPSIPEPFTGETLINGGTINLKEIMENSEFKNMYDYYLMFVDFIIAFALVRLAIKKWEGVVK